MPILQNWEVSPDRVKPYEIITTYFPVGNPIITSKCKLDKDRGFLVVGENGFGWRIKPGKAMGGKLKWVRWCDVFKVIHKKPGQIITELKLRKSGRLITDKRGYYKIIRWKFTIAPHKNEPKPKFTQRQAEFFNIMIQFLDLHRTNIDPPISDSNM